MAAITCGNRSSGSRREKLVLCFETLVLGFATLVLGNETLVLHSKSQMTEMLRGKSRKWTGICTY